MPSNANDTQQARDVAVSNVGCVQYSGNVWHAILTDAPAWYAQPGLTAIIKAITDNSNTKTMLHVCMCHQDMVPTALYQCWCWSAASEYRW